MEMIAQKTLDFMLYDWLGMEALADLPRFEGQTRGHASACPPSASAAPTPRWRTPRSAASTWAASSAHRDTSGSLGSPWWTNSTSPRSSELVITSTSGERLQNDFTQIWVAFF